MSSGIMNKRMADDVFHAIRKDVLTHWPTGADVNFDEAVAYQKNIKSEKRFSDKLLYAKENNITLTQPRGGVAVVDEHIKLLQYLEDEGEADLLPTTIDSYTRHNRYKEAQLGIEESLQSKRSMLNGFPAVNYGVAICRRVTSETRTPVQVRHGTPDARLLAEISVAGGFTSFEGGGISYNIPYSKNSTLEKTITDWQYVDRLFGLYEEAGVRINREPFGPLTGTLVPPCISNVVAIIESILAAAQGCKDITVGYGQCGNLIQDAAAIKALGNATNIYLKKYGYSDCTVTTVLHQWMGGFPEDESKAFGVISTGAVAATLSGATKVIVKSPHEAMGIPTMQANAAGLKTTRQVVSMLRGQSFMSASMVIHEYDVIMEEIECIMNAVDELGGGDIALGAVRAFEAGVIDVPFAPSKFNAGKLLPARDLDGAVRLLSLGSVPFRHSLKDFHRDKMEERAKSENRDVSFNMVVDDIYAIGNGYLITPR
ncbi:MAG: methylaspartate mutase subunit E [Defluviitaleaceae bacterium]|nr:methylaspartate mutase subunit E [Defluviitaleaceae bacterium]